jgi:hypothetical protein
MNISLTAEQPETRNLKPGDMTLKNRFLIKGEYDENR